jgi:hypothetical protein
MIGCGEHEEREIELFQPKTHEKPLAGAANVLNFCDSAGDEFPEAGLQFRGNGLNETRTLWHSLCGSQIKS